MEIIRSELFKEFPEIIFGFSTKIGLNRKPPYYFNLSFSVDDDKDHVLANRLAFYSSLGINPERIVLQKQTHSDIVTVVSEPGLVNNSDALITREKNLALGISSADCNAIFIYDSKNEIVAAVHSGWRGTEKRILEKTLKKLKSTFSSEPEHLFAYMAPAVTAENYEVGKEVADKFEPEFLSVKNSKYLLDLLSANKKMLLDIGVPQENIEQSGLCSFKEDELLHSYRRDGKKSGRALGIIAMRG